MEPAPSGESRIEASRPVAVTEGRRERQANEKKRKEALYGEEMVELSYMEARFMAAGLILTILEKRAYDYERVRSAIANDLRTAWPNIYDAPLNVEFWDLASQSGIDKEVVRNFRRPSDDPADWPGWIEEIKAAMAAGESVKPYGRELNRVYIMTRPAHRETLLNPISPIRKNWEDPKRQRLAALVDRMIEEVDWPAWPEQPDWEPLVDEYIIREIPDLVDEALEANRKRREQWNRLTR